ncbi:hypothetical protein E4T48_06749 [Aureobasidium sp. EXF-10727]|nr:hypothetical protein E4T48_06749 [Aureobasidium sp. EXF-10727]
MQFTTVVALLASSVAVNAMPGGGWGKTTSSCITKSTCSVTTVPWTSVITTPETSVSTCVTSSPVTHTTSENSVYTTTEATNSVGSSPKTVWSTVTETNVWTTWTEVSHFMRPSYRMRLSKTHTHGYNSPVVTNVPVTSTVYVTETKTTQVPKTYTDYTATTDYKTITIQKPHTTTGYSTESKCQSTTSWTTWGW